MLQSFLQVYKDKDSKLHVVYCIFKIELHAASAETTCSWLNLHQKGEVFSSKSIMAHDDKGEIIKGWDTHHRLGKARNAEADVILWLLKLAMVEEFNIIVEEDAKACFNDLYY